MVGHNTYTAFEASRPHFNALAMEGYFKLRFDSVGFESTSQLQSTLHYCYRAVVWIIVVVYNLQHVFRVIEVRHSTDRIVNTFFILLSTLNTMGKQLTFNIRSRRIDRLIAVLQGPVFASQNLHHEALLKINAVTMRRLLRFSFGCIFVCGTLWTLFPLVNRAMGETVEFTAYFPFDTNPSPTFELVVAYMNVFIILQGLGNVTMDCAIVSFYSQAKVQLQILRHNLEHLTCNSEVTKPIDNVILASYKDETDKRFKVFVQKKFVQCIVRHGLIKWFIVEIEDIFAEALCFQLLVSTWVTCMTVYKMVGLSLFSAEFLSMTMYLVCILCQLFIYCYFGTQVKYESQFLGQSLYCSNWMSLSPSFRRQLLIMMENCKRPITPHTAYIVPISLETYIGILRASYTLYTFLDQRKVH